MTINDLPDLDVKFWLLWRNECAFL